MEDNSSEEDLQFADSTEEYESIEGDDEDFHPEDGDVLVHVQDQAGQEESSSESDQEAGTPGRSREFNRELPDQHSYLGNSFNSLSGRTIFAENEVVELFVPRQSILPPLPGQVIPLAFFHSRDIATAKTIIEGNHTFGIIPTSDDLPKFGTTVEILQWTGRTGIAGFGRFGLDFGLRAKGEARQRFKILSTYTKRKGDNIHPVALVRILPETPVTKMLISCTSGHVLRSKRIKQAAQMTPYPPFVFDLYDPDVLLSRIRKEIENLFGGDTIIKAIPKLEITELCYWLILQLPFSDKLRMELLSMDSVIQRLRAILSMLKEFGRTVCCRQCSHLVARASDATSLSLRGAHGTFVNPGGYVHETLTYADATGVTVMARPTKKFSWFPGYAWQIVTCEACTSHLGWKFTNSNLDPQQFFCFTRTAVTLQVSEGSSGPSECTWVM